MARFREVLSDCDLSDIGFTDKWFTWERGRLPSNNVRERLDRGVTNQAWWNLFPKHSLKNLAHAIFNHCPLSVDLRVRDSSIQRKNRFKFNTSRALEEECEHHIRYFWDKNSGELPSKLQQLGMFLSKEMNQL